MVFTSYKIQHNPTYQNLKSDANILTALSATDNKKHEYTNSILLEVLLPDFQTYCANAKKLNDCQAKFVDQLTLIPSLPTNNGFDKSHSILNLALEVNRNIIKLASLNTLNIIRSIAGFALVILLATLFLTL